MFRSVKYIAQQQKELAKCAAMVHNTFALDILQVSAHILQNLLLWWKLSAALRGCAFFLPLTRV